MFQGCWQNLTRWLWYYQWLISGTINCIGVNLQKLKPSVMELRNNTSSSSGVQHTALVILLYKNKNINICVIQVERNVKEKMPWCHLQYGCSTAPVDWAWFCLYQEAYTTHTLAPWFEVKSKWGWSTILVQLCMDFEIQLSLICILFICLRCLILTNTKQKQTRKFTLLYFLAVKLRVPCGSVDLI